MPNRTILVAAMRHPSQPCAPPVGIVGRYIPNSPTNVIDAGLTAQRESGWFGALRARHFGSAPLVEDNSAKSPQYTTSMRNWVSSKSKQWLVALDVFNIADVKWNDIEYYYVSRLKNEASPSPTMSCIRACPEPSGRTSRIIFE